MNEQANGVAEFVLARIAEDEAWAKLARDSSDRAPWHQGMGHLKGHVVSHAGLGIAETRGSNIARFVSMHDPARVLAECEAKRRIMERHCEDGFADPECSWCGSSVGWPCPDLLDLASPYADHPDYRDEWRA